MAMCLETQKKENIGSQIIEGIPQRDGFHGLRCFKTAP